MLVLAIEKFALKTSWFSLVVVEFKRKILSLKYNSTLYQSLWLPNYWNQKGYLSWIHYWILGITESFSNNFILYKNIEEVRVAVEVRLQLMPIAPTLLL